jgi:hypothetical protein
MASAAARAVSEVTNVAGGVARHAAWWLRYRVHGSTRPAPPEPKRRTPPARRSAE